MIGPSIDPFSIFSRLEWASSSSIERFTLVAVGQTAYTSLFVKTSSIIVEYSEVLYAASIFRRDGWELICRIYSASITFDLMCKQEIVSTF